MLQKWKVCKKSQNAKRANKNGCGTGGDWEALGPLKRRSFRNDSRNSSSDMHFGKLEWESGLSGWVLTDGIESQYRGEKRGTDSGIDASTPSGRKGKNFAAVWGQRGKIS